MSYNNDYAYNINRFIFQKAQKRGKLDQTQENVILILTL
jgi:hypothetical protein